MKKQKRRRTRRVAIMSVTRLACAWLSLACSVFVMAQPPARMGISPDRYQITFDERGGETQALMVHNLSNSPMTVNLTVSNWDLDENNNVRVIAPTETSLDQWIVLNPVTVTIPPGAPQTIRWAVMPRLQPAPGEYRALVFIEDIGGLEQDGGEGARMRMKMRYGLPIYAQVGERIQSARLNSINVDRDNNRIFLDITNTGNSHGRLSGYFGIWRLDEFPGQDAAVKLLDALDSRDSTAQGFVPQQMPATVILPDTQRSIPLRVELQQPGDYVLQFNGEFAGMQIIDTIRITQPGN